MRGSRQPRRTRLPRRSTHLFYGDLIHRVTPLDGDSGIVDQGIEPAELLVDALDRSIDMRLVGDVELDEPDAGLRAPSFISMQLFDRPARPRSGSSRGDRVSPLLHRDGRAAGWEVQASRGQLRIGAGRRRVTPQGVGQDGHTGRRRRRLSVADLPVGMVLHGRLERPRVSDALSRSRVLSTPTR